MMSEEGDAERVNRALGGKTPTTILVDGQEVTVDTSDITILCHHGDVDIQPKDGLVLDAETTVYHGKRVQRLHPEAQALIDKFPATMPEPARSHIRGLIDLTLKLQDLGVPIFWKLPETYLHPSQQVLLADLAIYFGKRS